MAERPDGEPSDADRPDAESTDADRPEAESTDADGPDVDADRGPLPAFDRSTLPDLDRSTLPAFDRSTLPDIGSRLPGVDPNRSALPDADLDRHLPDVDRPAPTRRRLLALAGLGVVGTGTWDVVRGARDVDVAGPENRPDVAAAAVDAYVRGCTAFGLDLLAELVDADPDRNLMVSPVGLSGALAMAWAGARGETERRMAETLHFPHGQARLHPAVGALQHDLDRRGQGVNHREVPEVWNVNRFELGLANALWGQVDTPFRESLLETLERNYGSPLRTVDFEADPAGARRRVNRWAREVSDGRVGELVPPGTFDLHSKALLANVVALRADWQHPFDPADTDPGEFTRPDGSTVEVPMMHQKSEFPLVEGRTGGSGDGQEDGGGSDDGGSGEDGTPDAIGYRVVELPYVSGDLSMVLAVPLRDHSLSDLEAVVDAAWLAARFEELDGSTDTYDVNVTMPRFTFGNDLELRDRLAALGMTTAFDDRRANFEGVTDPPGVAEGFYLKRVFHDTHVAVDEEGTVAVAVSGIALQNRVSASPSIRLDRPFLFCIRDRATDAVLFLGRVVDPSRE